MIYFKSSDSRKDCYSIKNLDAVPEEVFSKLFGFVPGSIYLDAGNTNRIEPENGSFDISILEGDVYIVSGEKGDTKDVLTVLKKFANNIKISDGHRHLDFKTVCEYVQDRVNSYRFIAEYLLNKAEGSTVTETGAPKQLWPGGLTKSEKSKLSKQIKEHKFEVVETNAGPMLQGKKILKVLDEKRYLIAHL